MGRFSLSYLPLFPSPRRFCPDEIHDAARRGDVAKVKQLIDNGVDVDVQEQSPKDPASSAAETGQCSLVKRPITSSLSDCFWISGANPKRKITLAGRRYRSRSKWGTFEIAEVLARSRRRRQRGAAIGRR